MLAAPAARRRWWPVLLAFLAVVGPGIITANVDNDAGGITTYTLTGSDFGYTLLWTLLPITIARIVVQEMCARRGGATGKGLADLIRESFGVKITFWMMVALIVANVGNTIAEFAGIAASLAIFGVPAWVCVPLAALAVWLLVLKGNAKTVERVFLVACAFYLAYPVSAILAKPPWGDTLIATVTPTIHPDSKWIAMVIALIGTTIAPWMQFYIQSAIVEKGIKPEQYAMSRLDVVVGCIVTDVVAFFIIVACAATLHVNGVHVTTADQAAGALKPLAGKYCALLFSFGLFNASLFAASILPLSTAFPVCEAFGWESGVDKKYHEAKQFYWLYSLVLFAGAAVVLIPKLPLVPVMLVSQVANGVLLPFVLVLMLVLAGRERIMGKMKNGRAMTIIGWTTTVVTSALTLWLVGSAVRDYVHG